MFKFLHVGAEASRKGAKEVMGGFRHAFPKRDGVELNLKIISQGWKIGSIRGINILNSKMSLTELIQLYHDNHVYVYPSYGEGFGLTPLQAMATGMPTITVPDWAPYANYLDPKLTISSKMVRSPWPQLHPGNMLKPNMDEVIDRMRYAYNNYSQVTDFSYGIVTKLTEYYNWDRLTKEAFDALESRLK
jgi:glycosyltransferase involved in cell wall biosynthesis